MEAYDLYKEQQRIRIVEVKPKKVYQSVMEFFKEAYNSGSLFGIAKAKADAWTGEREEIAKENYLNELKRDHGFFSGIFHTAPKPYSEDFKEGFAAGYVEATQKNTFLANNVSKEKLDNLLKYLIDNGISITAVNNELLIQNSREEGEVRLYKLSDE